jgi:hypothetical protein
MTRMTTVEVFDAASTRNWLLLLLLHICLAYRIGGKQTNISVIRCNENDTFVMQETCVYVAVRTVLIEPLASNGRLASTPIFRLSGRVYRALLNNRLFQLVVPATCINKPLPMQWIHMSQYIPDG